MLQKIKVIITQTHCQKYNESRYFNYKVEIPRTLTMPCK